MGLRMIDIEPQYRRLKKDDPGRILLFRDGGFCTAILDDARAILDLTADHQVPIWRDEPGIVAKFGAARLESVLEWIVAAGGRAAVLERVADRPHGRQVERIVTDLADEHHLEQD